MSATVELVDVRHAYGRVQALGPLDLRLDGGVTGLVGPNGAGKTTLLRLLATTAGVQSGTLRLFGTDPGRRSHRRNARRQLGYLPQQFGTPRRVTVRQLLTHAAWMREVPRAARAAAVAAAMATVDLTEHADRPMGTLSGGMVRRAALAQAIVHRPALLLLDEPTTGLDPGQRVLFRAFVRRASESAAVLFSSHLVEDVRAVADRVVVLGHGHVAFDGSVEELEARADDQYPGDNALERGLAAVLVKAP